ncbi:DNA-3-methyladenine glycosylase I [Microbacteriaceae bacterium VKM Ac-2855]|nr:DNA-3-methyladenine glycosylase I [Microbacteriaceae bacterium VKM Ac-2855]
MSDITPPSAGRLARPPLITDADGVTRCAWAGGDTEYGRYHDEEWGTALHGDRPLFEKICLEGFQAGLSWITILRKRSHFREVFAGFDIDAVAEFGDERMEELMTDTGIIRNRAKISATIGNARAARRLRENNGDGALDRLVWSFVPDAPPPRPESWSDARAVTPESTALSKELLRQGFRFVGPTTMYALMQSAGLVDDHFAGCFRAR